MIRGTHRKRRLQAGNAIVETIVALVALVPFLIGIPLLGKQLDVKQKSYDAARYSVWERTVYRSDGVQKSASDIEVEMRDRTLGNARAGLRSASTVRSAGVTQNVLWRDRANQKLLVANGNGSRPVTYSEARGESPVAIGAVTVPQIAYGSNAVANAVMTAVGVDSLGFDRNSFATANVSVNVRPLLSELAARPIGLSRASGQQAQQQNLTQTAAGGILSDTWSPRSEDSLRSRIDNLVANERVWQSEMAGMALGFLGGKGTPLYGEGQYGFGRGYIEGPDLTVPSTSLPNNYVYTQR